MRGVVGVQGDDGLGVETLGEVISQSSRGDSGENRPRPLVRVVRSVSRKIQCTGTKPRVAGPLPNRDPFVRP